MNIKQTLSKAMPNLFVLQLSLHDKKKGQNNKNVDGNPTPN